MQLIRTLTARHDLTDIIPGLRNDTPGLRYAAHKCFDQIGTHNRIANTDLTNCAAASSAVSGLNRGGRDGNYKLPMCPDDGDLDCRAWTGRDNSLQFRKIMQRRVAGLEYGVTRH